MYAPVRDRQVPARRIGHQTNLCGLERTQVGAAVQLADKHCRRRRLGSNLQNVDKTVGHLNRNPSEVVGER